MRRPAFATPSGQLLSACRKLLPPLSGYVRIDVLKIVRFLLKEEDIFQNVIGRIEKIVDGSVFLIHFQLSL